MSYKMRTIIKLTAKISGFFLLFNLLFSLWYSHSLLNESFFLMVTEPVCPGFSVLFWLSDDERNKDQKWFYKAVFFNYLFVELICIFFFIRFLCKKEWITCFFVLVSVVTNIYILFGTCKWYIKLCRAEQ